MTFVAVRPDRTTWVLIVPAASPSAGRRKWTVSERGSGRPASAASARRTGSTAYPPFGLAPIDHAAASRVAYVPAPVATTAVSSSIWPTRP